MNLEIIITLILTIIIGLFLFYQKIANLNREHSDEVLDALEKQRAKLKGSHRVHIITLERQHTKKVENLEKDFLGKIRMLGQENDNILTNYENKVPIMSFALENSMNVRHRMPSPIEKIKDKMYHNNGYVFSFSDTDELPYHRVYELVRQEVAKWLIDNQMIIGRFNVASDMVEFRIRYLHFKP